MTSAAPSSGGGPDGGGPDSRPFGDIAIVGVHEHPTRWAPDKTEFQIMAECARGALEDCGLALADVDGLFGASMTMGAMGVIELAEYLNLKPTYVDGTNIGGSSFVAHVNHAAAAIHAGMCEVALILYGAVAASLPVWLMLAPRDYLSTFLKIGTIVALALGIYYVAPLLAMPATTRFIDGTGPVFSGKLFPFLFITIACGAVSGFHSLISSGTTPKMIEN